jgi:starch synthase (maltosyl-transferring)
MGIGPKIYNLFPPLAGTTEGWTSHLDRIAEMEFDWIFLNPFQYPGFSGSLYAIKDYRRLNPLFRADSGRDDLDQIADFVKAAESRGLSVMMDLVLNHTSRDSIPAEKHPEWFRRDENGELASPFVTDPDDPAKVTVWGDLAELDYANPDSRDRIVGFWCDLVRLYTDIGIRGFRADAAYKVPADVWRRIIQDARGKRAGVVFFAETLGCRPEEVVALHEAGFDHIFNSSKWWDFKAPWLIEQYETYRHIAPSIAFPESHDTERLASELMSRGIRTPETIEAIYRQRYLFAATFSTGVMMPIGFEFGFRKQLDVVATRPGDWEEPMFDLQDFIAETNRMKAALPALNMEGPQSWSMPDGKGDLAMLRRDDAGNWAFVVINPDHERRHGIQAQKAKRLGAGEDGVEFTPGHSGTALKADARLNLAPAAVRVFANRHESTTAGRANSDLPQVVSLAGLRSRPIMIENIYPELDGGRFPVKRAVGDELDVWADIFREGHDKIAASLLYRRHDETRWHETPMHLVEPGLDRWRGAILLEENTRYAYTIEAWPDPYESWLAELEKKRAAGMDVSLELMEGRELVADAATRAEEPHITRLKKALLTFDEADGPDDRAAALTAARVRKAVANAPDRGNAVRCEKEHEVVVDRNVAVFAAWYEMFPRSQGKDPTRSATFGDCAARLGEIREMGFDVVYLVPIHPIGRTNRKGANNSLKAHSNDPGSPYAIGGVEGGHDAVHPELGTLEDFREFVRQVREHEMEVALDFAIQCSPDHPWLKEHPDWFSYRPDGTIKYAENPPKKYQDIVNVNFYGGHREELWNALRDVVLFWVEQGVRILRVDNPHTKPIPFWEWLIREVQLRHPDVIFLSEAFTRPKVLKSLAKVGFTQSYTYFTWRNFKEELTDYFTELSQHECAEYLRPNLFTNTPDILPKYLQEGGPPAFRIRLVLAATLSSIYGIYNGFELCEGTPVPGTEEYLDSEKYQYKVWDWDRPGNIKDYIAKVNRIRRDNEALQEFRNLRFHPSSDGHVIFYSKRSPWSDNLVFVAVNLDPFGAHESELRLPLHELGIGDEDPYEVEELLSGAKHLWQGSSQNIGLNPHENPAAIFLLKGWTRVDYREPCF